MNAVSKPLPVSDRLILVGHLMAAVSTALIAIGSSLKLQEEGRLTATQPPVQDKKYQPPNIRTTVHDYFNT